MSLTAERHPAWSSSNKPLSAPSGAAATLLGWALLCSSGCQPCEADADCPALMYCAEEEQRCVQDCQIPGDCPSLDHGCSEQGRCIQALAPSIQILRPAEEDVVGERFDAEIEVAWVGAEVAVRIDRDPSEPGEACSPFTPIETTLIGDAQRETRQRLVLPDIPSMARGSFRLRAQASTDPEDPRYDVVAVFGELPEDTLVGAEILAPVEGPVRDDPPISVPLEIVLPQSADRVWAYTESLDGLISTPRRSLGVQVTELEDLRVPIMRGAQVLRLEVERGGQTKHCSVGLTTTPATFTRLEVAMFFQGVEPGDLDLWVYSQPDDAELETCNVHQGNDGLCGEPHTTLGLRDWGEEAVQLDLRDGIYGLAVAPGAVSEPVTATLRVGRGENHLAWLGPRTVITDLGNVWLAGRIYIVGGSVTVEPLDIMHPGLPSEMPGAW